MIIYKHSNIPLLTNIQMHYKPFIRQFLRFINIGCNVIMAIQIMFINVLHTIYQPFTNVINLSVIELLFHYQLMIAVVIKEGLYWVTVPCFRTPLRWMTRATASDLMRSLKREISSYIHLLINRNNLSCFILNWCILIGDWD